MSLPSGQRSAPISISSAVDPLGSPPDLYNPPSLAGAVFAVGTTLLIVSALSVVLRLITNYRVVGKLKMADYLCLFAFILMTCYYAVISVLWENARQAWNVSPSPITVSYLKTAAVQKSLIGPTLWSTKASILALYIQLFGSKHWLRRASYSALIITFLIYWANTPLTWMYCTPRDGASWNAQTLTRCEKLAIMFPIHGAVGLAADLFILILPLPIIYQLNLNTRRKIGLATIFLTGIFTVVTSTISLYYRVKTYKGVDPAWNTAKNTILLFAEGFVTIIVSCAPAASSFWNNILTQSAFYSKSSSIFLSLVSCRRYRSRNLMEEASVYNKGQQLPISISHLNDKQRYVDFDDSAYGRLTMEMNAPKIKIFYQ